MMKISTPTAASAAYGRMSGLADREVDAPKEP